MNATPSPREAWRSTESGLIVEVVRATDAIVWYMHPSWTYPVDCARYVWNATMERVTDKHQAAA